jgi:hypothetical protein
VRCVFDLRNRNADRRSGLCFAATKKHPETVQRLFEDTELATCGLFQRQSKLTGFTPEDMQRWCFVKLLQYNNVGCQLNDIEQLLHVSQDVWEDKVTPLALCLHSAVDVLDPKRRFLHNNHAPMLPACITGITDTFPKIINASCLKNGKYGYKCGKGSIVCTFDGTVIDWQGLGYGNRTDLSFMDALAHTTALQLHPWEYILGDMAYTAHRHCLTAYKLNRALSYAEMVRNLVLSHYRSRVEAVIGQIKVGKGIFSLPWRGEMETLDALLKIEVHASQLERDMWLGPRYHDVEGMWAHGHVPGQV